MCLSEYKVEFMFVISKRIKHFNNLHTSITICNAQFLLNSFSIISANRIVET